MKQFEKVQAFKTKRSAFDLSHERKTTCNMGELIPVLCAEVLPGDRFKIDFEAFIRTLPLISPVMHRVNVFAHAFFVPNRLLLATERWEQIITQKNPNDLVPRFESDAWYAGYYPTESDLLDHLGYGYKMGSNFNGGCVMSQLPVRAYHKIWNDYYRDQNFQDEYDIISLPDSIDGTTPGKDVLCGVRNRAWEKDYFTSALPTQQRGAAVGLPLGTSAPIISNSQPMSFKQSGGSDADSGALKVAVTPSGVMEDSTNHPLYYGDGLEADLAGSTGSTISALRRAFALQRWFEASMRFGQRYTEQLLAFFGVMSRDSRLQRAEYICGGKLPIQIGEVLQTSGSDITGQTTPQGNMAGRAVSAGQMFHLDRSFDEHGYVMVILSILPRTSYKDVALRQNFKISTFDFAFPQLAHLSEQPVYYAELWNQFASDPLGKAVWGYQPMYEEYRFMPDSIHGAFRSSLHYWSMAREFASAPDLNESFIVSDPSTAIFPVDAPNQQILVQSFAKFLAIRPLPKFGTPV